jgi:hypothetical protein
MRDYRREASLDDALTGSSCNLQKWLAEDAAGPGTRAEATERGALPADALSQLAQRERKALILQKVLWLEPGADRRALGLHDRRSGRSARPWAETVA